MVWPFLHKGDDIAVVLVVENTTRTLCQAHPVPLSTRRSLPRIKNEVVRFHRHGICRPVSPPVSAQILRHLSPDMTADAFV